MKYLKNSHKQHLSSVYGIITIKTLEPLSRLPDRGNSRWDIYNYGIIIKDKTVPQSPDTLMRYCYGVLLRSWIMENEFNT